MGESEDKSKNDKVKDIASGKYSGTRKGTLPGSARLRTDMSVKSPASVQDGGTDKPQVVKPSCPVC